MIGGYDFAHVIGQYWAGYENGNDQLMADAVRWLRGEFTTKTDARNALGVRTIVDDANVYDMLKLMARFVAAGRVRRAAGVLRRDGQPVQAREHRRPQRQLRAGPAHRQRLPAGPRHRAGRRCSAAPPSCSPTPAAACTATTRSAAGWPRTTSRSAAWPTTPGRCCGWRTSPQRTCTCCSPSSATSTPAATRRAT